MKTAHTFQKHTPIELAKLEQEAQSIGMDFQTFLDNLEWTSKERLFRILDDFTNKVTVAQIIKVHFDLIYNVNLDKEPEAYYSPETIRELLFMSGNILEFIAATFTAWDKFKKNNSAEVTHFMNFNWPEHKEKAALDNR